MPLCGHLAPAASHGVLGDAMWCAGYCARTAAVAWLQQLTAYTTPRQGR